MAFRPSLTRLLIAAAAAAAIGSLPGPALATQPMLALEAPGGKVAEGSRKESPYAAAQDETGAPQPSSPDPTRSLQGKLAEGSQKDSPYAAAKEVGSSSLEPTLSRLWRLLVPLLLAAGSYGWLRRREA
jgi:hypothetical protein